MKRTSAWTGLGIALAVLLGAGTAPAGPAAPAAPAAKAGAAAPKVKAVKLLAFHRVFQNFRDEVTTPLRQDFRVGDSDYTARIVEWVPDFAMDMKTKKIGSRGTEPKNPAFRIVVRKAGVPQDTVWAFFNMPPHFSSKSVLGFMATQIEFLDRAPLLSQDSLAVQMREAAKERSK